MPIDLLKNIVDLCPKDTPLLGMDVGKKTIGLAQCGPDQSLATPITTVKRTKFTKDLGLIDKVVAEFESGGFVIGLPVNMDGSEGPRAQSVRDFAAEFYAQGASFPNIKRFSQSAETKADLWIALVDERLSTHTVDEIVDKSVGKRKTKQESKSSGLKDKLAAQIILQNALDMIQAKA